MTAMIPHDNRFHVPPPLAPAEEKDYPAGFKPGDPGFIEALCREAGIPYIEEPAS